MFSEFVATFGLLAIILGISPLSPGSRGTAHGGRFPCTEAYWFRRIDLLCQSPDLPWRGL